jgi:hypothetical protein
MMEYNMRDLYETYTRDIRFNSYINADDDINNARENSIEEEE